MPDSAWTETGSSISLVPVTSTIDPGSNSTNVNYLTNSYKAALMQQYAGELAMKTSLDSLAATWTVSSAAYDSSVAAINATLVNAGAPSNWATIWPDGTTSGPWAGIQTALSGDWAAIATQRTTLQAAISATQAIVSSASAQPHIVSWAYASKPALPSSSYPAGYYAITSDFRTVQVNAAGTAWVDILISAKGLFGTLDAATISVINLNASNIATGTLSASMVLFPDGTQLSTANRVTTAFKQPSADTAVSASTIVIPGWSWPVTVHSANDVFNFFGALTAEQTSGTTNSPVNFYFYVDGVFANSYPCVPRFPTLSTWYVFPISATIAGLSTGAHTIAIYANCNNSYPFTVKMESRVTCQQIY
jgi:hypothetical protein